LWNETKSKLELLKSFCKHESVRVGLVKVGKPYNAADGRMLIFLNVVEGLSLYGGGHWTIGGNRWGVSELLQAVYTITNP